MNSALKGKINYNKLTGKLNVGKEYIKPTGTIDITSNGTFDVADYGTANIAVTEDGLIEKIITFMDYDGTLLYEIPLQNLTEMPPLPEHEGLICQGWNWTLDEIKEEDASLYVGALYITDDEKTRIYITLEETDLNMWLTFRTAKGDETIVDWGDDTEPYVSTDEPNTIVSINHIYEKPGNYVMTFYTSEAATANYLFHGQNESYSNLLRRSVAPSTSSINWSTKAEDALIHVITKVELGARCTLSTAAFGDAINLETVTTPIGQIFPGTFHGCSKLHTLVWYGSAYLRQGAFTDSGLITLITSKGFDGQQDVFNNTMNQVSNCLKQMYLPSGMKVTPHLRGTGYTLDKIPSSLTTLCETKPEDRFDYVPPSVIRFGTYSMSGYKGDTFVFPETDGTIYAGNHIFDGNKNITHVKLPKRIVLSTSADTSYMFNGCCNLQLVDWGGCETITKFGTSMFNGCYNIKNITIPEGITELGSNCFTNCRNLQNIHIPDSVTTIGSYCFQNCWSLKSIDLSNITTSSSPSYLFQNCYQLSYVVLPNNLPAIDYGAFSGCYKLKTINIPGSVTSFKNSCFQNCISLETVTINGNVSSFGTSVFNGCSKLKVVDFQNNTTIPTVTTSTFPSGLDLKIVVPDDLYDTWITTGNWTGYASYIIKASDYTE